MKRFRLIYGKEVKKNDIKEALELDYICYEEKYYLDLEACLRYYDKNPWIYFMALDDSNSVIGYINLSHISKEKYEELRSGNEMDTSIVADDLVEYQNGQDCYLYFSSIYVHPEWRQQGVARTLLAQTDKFMRKLALNNIGINGIIADAVSEVGKQILLRRGFEVVCESDHQSIIMEKKYDRFN